MPRTSSHRSGRTKLECPRCHEPQLARIARRGFLRNRVFPLFGYYPWQCAMCGKHCLLRKRSAGYKRNPEPQRLRSAASPQSDQLPVG